jgi:putative transcriptional regulator
MDHLFQSTSLKGYLLMAMPMLMDPNFRQSVTCISEHTDEGAVGVVVNRVYEGIEGRMIFEELEIECNAAAAALPIHIGGPVHTHELFVLHGPPLDWTDSLKINDALALSNSRAILEAIARGEGPRDFIITLGCAGWGPGQLEWEMSQNAWLVTPCSHDILFAIPPPERWESAIKRLGIDPQSLSGAAGHA